MKKSVLTVFLFIVSMTALSGNQDYCMEDFNIQPLGDNILKVTVMDSMKCNVVAIRSEKGVVVVDSTYSPHAAKYIRGIIESYFKGSPLCYLINTHGHGDHTFGNQIFSDLHIIGHESVVQEMEKSDAKRQNLVKRYNELLPILNKQLKDAEDSEKEALKDRIRTMKRSVEELGDTFTPTVPDIFFSNSKVIELGDKTLQLYWFGVCHSRSDLLIYCPEEKLLLTGDLFYKGSTPYLDSERVTYLSHWGKSLSQFFTDYPAPEKIVPGHGDNLDRGILVETLGFISSNIKIYAGREAAVPVFKDIMEQKGVEEGLKELRRMFNNQNRFYLFYEELDSMAFKMMMDGNIDNSLQILTCLTDLYPDNYLAFDSLGEVLLKKGNEKDALNAFEKSLKLNPENRNAVHKITTIKNGG